MGDKETLLGSSHSCLQSIALQEDEPTERRVQLSNLIARFRTQPVLSQKCAILDVLRQLAYSDSAGISEARTAAGAGSQHRHANSTSRSGAQNRNDDMETLEEQPAQGHQAKKGNLERANGTARAGKDNSTALGPRGEVAPGPMTLEDSDPSEAALLRDLPFTLQGLSTTNLPFTDTSILKLPATLPLPLISLLHTLAEPSLLYRNLSNFVQSSDEGLVGQSLRAAIGNELRSYLGLIATLEGEIRRALTSVGGIRSRGNIGKVGVTLKRCVIWTREATMGLRLMSLMVEEASSTFSPGPKSTSTDSQQAGKVAN